MSAVKNIVAQHKSHRIVPDKLFADKKSLGQSLRPGLDGVGEFHAEAGAVTEKPLK